MTRNKGKRLNNYVKDYIVFDLETTGLRPELDAIIEISAIKVENGDVLSKYSTLVNPEMHIPASATAVNGITDEMVAAAPGLYTAVGEFLEFIGDSILVGHNIHTFDTNFIYDAAVSTMNREVRNDYIDTLYMSRKCLPQLAHHRLSDISEYFNIDISGAHRALNDCIMNQKCYEELGRLMALRNEPEILCPECGKEMIRRKGKFGEFYGCTGFPECRGTRKIKG